MLFWLSSSYLSVKSAMPQPQPPDDQILDTVHKTVIFENVVLGFGDLTVLNGVSFELKRGETKGLLGVSESGQSTVLKLCPGLIKPDAGHNYVLRHDVTTRPDRQ